MSNVIPFNPTILNQNASLLEVRLSQVLEEYCQAHAVSVAKVVGVLEIIKMDVYAQMRGDE